MHTYKCILLTETFLAKLSHHYFAQNSGKIETLYKIWGQTKTKSKKVEIDFRSCFAKGVYYTLLYHWGISCLFKDTKSIETENWSFIQSKALRFGRIESLKPLIPIFWDKIV
jgi:hypothetical protein